MDKQIVAIHHSEERYSSLTIVAYTQEQREQIRKTIEKRVPLNDSNISVSESEVDDILETTIEYHDDYDKQSGEIFETIIRCLHITECN